MTGLIFLKVNGHLVNIDKIVEISPAFQEDKKVHQVLIDCGQVESDETGGLAPVYLIAWVARTREEAEQVAEALATAIGTVVVPDLKKFTPAEATHHEQSPVWPKVMDLVEFMDKEGRIDPKQRGKSYYLQVIALGTEELDRRAVKVRLVFADPGWIQEHPGGWEDWVCLADLKQIPRTWPWVGEVVEVQDENGILGGSREGGSKRKSWRYRKRAARSA